MEDETKTIPDVPNLQEFVESTIDLETKPEVKETKSETKVDGKTIQFKTLDDAFKAYQEVQGFAARTVQEKKELEQKLSQLQEQIELMKYQSPVVNQTAPQDFDTRFIQNPEQAIEAKVTEKVLTARIADVLAEEQTKDQVNFADRYQYAQRIVNQFYPQLGQTPMGVRKAFELGDRLRKDEMRSQAERAIKLTFGEDVDLEKFKALIKKEQAPLAQNNSNLAYMPDTGLHSGTRTQSGSQGADSRLNDAVAKGDIDTVIAGTFQRILAGT